MGERIKAILVKAALGFLIIVISIFLYVFFFVLRSPWNPGRTPPLEPGILWVSNNPNMWFEWVEGVGAIGEIKNNDEVVEIIVLWGGPAPRLDIYRYSGEGPADCLALGSCEFFENKGTIWISEDIANIFNGAETITFVRQDRETAVLP